MQGSARPPAPHSTFRWEAPRWERAVHGRTMPWEHRDFTNCPSRVTWNWALVCWNVSWASWTALALGLALGLYQNCEADDTWLFTENSSLKPKQHEIVMNQVPNKCMVIIIHILNAFMEKDWVSKTNAVVSSTPLSWLDVCCFVPLWHLRKKILCSTEINVVATVLYYCNSYLLPPTE